VPSSDRLATYRRKRDFKKTPEPRGRSTKANKEPRFVVQKHNASSLHYDFRLEADGVLKSWAVPKGPPKRAQDKRLAMPTEDHPLDYLTFEGEIPDGEYGAGTVEIWDIGTYENRTERNAKPIPMRRALTSGHVVIDMHGDKLKGTFALTRIGDGKRPRWLLVRTKKR
jgi:DNA ligase D-like protein (predicted 3'-phosphoesterase)